MKKEGIITIIIVIVILLGEWGTQKYTNKQLGMVESELRELKENILQAESESATSDFLERTNEIYDSWEEKNDVLSYYLEHDELEKVNTQIVLIKGYLETEDAEDAVPEIEEGLYILQHIKNKQEFNLKNIL